LSAKLTKKTHSFRLFFWWFAHCERLL